MRTTRLRPDRLDPPLSRVVGAAIAALLLTVVGCSADAPRRTSERPEVEACKPPADLVIPAGDGPVHSGTMPGLSLASVEIPRESDWVEHGVVLENGPRGAWDASILGPSAVVKKSGTYFLYYRAADGPRSSDEGPRHRAVGVATSSDGSSFMKFEGNPVMTHRPRGGEEEGANTAAVSLDDDGNFVMYYGAATQKTGDSITADVKVAVSSDGFEFTDLGVAMEHTDSSVYGHGDELFPTAAFRWGKTWFLFYFPNGTAASWDVALAWGAGPVELASTTCVLNGSKQHPSSLASAVSALADDTLGVFVKRGWWPDTVIEVRTTSPRTPHLLSEPLQTYSGPVWNRQTKAVTVFLDREAGRWMLFRSNYQGEITLHVAPMVTSR